jgi:energy-converting hydrogenase Eha subunit A
MGKAFTNMEQEPTLLIALALIHMACLCLIVAMLEAVGVALPQIQQDKKNNKQWGLLYSYMDI